MDTMNFFIKNRISFKKLKEYLANILIYNN